MKNVIVFVVILMVVTATGYILLFGSIMGVSYRVPASQYVTRGSDCWVRPQGDPLYDQHYAQNVNPYNCNAYKVQEEAQNIEAQTKQIDWNTEQGKIGVYSVLGVVTLIFILLVFAVIGGKNGTA